MLCESIFYFCEKCGVLLDSINHEGHNLTCCGYPMKKLVANSVDAAKEKHVPQVTKTDDGVFIKVGSVEHPMEPEHFIEFIYVKTDDSVYYKKLSPGQSPEATFKLDFNKICAVYEYCNIHGLWVSNIK